MPNLRNDPVVGFYATETGDESVRLTKMEAMEKMLSGVYVHAFHHSGKWSRMTLNPGSEFQEVQEMLNEKHFPAVGPLPVDPEVIM